MSRIFRMADSLVEELSLTPSLKERVHLQDLLFRNPLVIPGEQIEPGAAREWVVLAREVQIPEPDNGRLNWSLDLLLADQDGIPTFVECKLDQNHESRREVIGQLIEYAANAQYYWSIDEYRNQLLEQIHRCELNIDTSFEERVRKVAADVTGGDFMSKFFQSLLKSEFRLVLVVDVASRRLKSSVEFVNRQLHTIDFFIVELRHVSYGEDLLIAPQVFGFTEEIRSRKAMVAGPADTQGAEVDRHWDSDRFRRVLMEQSKRPDLSDKVLAFRALALSKGYVSDWGKGVRNGSFGVRRAEVSAHRVVSVETSGKLWFNIDYVAPEQRAAFRSAVSQRFAIADSVSAKFLPLDLVSWVDRQDDVLEVVGELPAKHKPDAKS